MQAKEVRNKNIKELIKMLGDQEKSLEKFMHDVYKGKEKNLSKPRSIRKDIARIKTVLAEKKFLAEEQDNV